MALPTQQTNLLDPKGILTQSSTAGLNQQQLQEMILEALKGEMGSRPRQQAPMLSPLQAVGDIMNSAADKFNLNRLLQQQNQLQQSQPDVSVPGAAGDTSGAAPASFPSSSPNATLNPNQNQGLTGGDDSGFTRAMQLSTARETSTSGLGALLNISPDAANSKSYGPWGLNSKTGSAAAFVKEHPELGITAEPGTTEFDQQWRQAARSSTKGMMDAHQDWYQKNYWGPSTALLTNSGVNQQIASDPRVKMFMSDRTLQMGHVGLNNALAAARQAQTPEQFIQTVTQADNQNLGSNFRTYLSARPQDARGLLNRNTARAQAALGFNAQASSPQRMTDVGAVGATPGAQVAQAAPPQAQPSGPVPLPNMPPVQTRVPLVQPNASQAAPAPAPAAPVQRIPIRSEQEAAAAPRIAPAPGDMPLPVLPAPTAALQAAQPAPATGPPPAPQSAPAPATAPPQGQPQAQPSPPKFEPYQAKPIPPDPQDRAWATQEAQRINSLKRTNPSQFAAEADKFRQMMTQQDNRTMYNTQYVGNRWTGYKPIGPAPPQFFEPTKVGDITPAKEQLTYDKAGNLVHAPIPGASSQPAPAPERAATTTAPSTGTGEKPNAPADMSTFVAKTPNIYPQEPPDNSSTGAWRKYQSDVKSYDESAKDFQTEYRKIANASADARNNDAQLAVLEKVLNDPRVINGYAQGTITNLDKAMEAVGLGKGERAAVSAIAKKLGSQQITNQIRETNIGQGVAVRETEAHAIYNANYDENNVTPANRAVVALMRKAEQRLIENGQFANLYADKHGRLDNGYYKSRDDWFAQHPLFSDEELNDAQQINKLMAAGKPAPAAEVTGSAGSNPQYQAAIRETKPGDIINTGTWLSGRGLPGGNPGQKLLGLGSAVTAGTAGPAMAAATPAILGALAGKGAAAGHGVGDWAKGGITFWLMEHLLNGLTGSGGK